MRFKEIELPLNEESQEYREKIKGLEAYCKEQGLEFFQSRYSPDQRFIRVMVKDIYNSEEMKEIITLSQEQNWERGEAISKSSRNVFEAYQKALKEYKEQRAYFSERKMSKAEDKLYKDLIGFKEYLKNRIVNKVMDQYSRIEEKK